MAEIFSCCQAAVLAILDKAPDRTSQHKKPRKSQFGFKGVPKFLSDRTAVLGRRLTPGKKSRQFAGGRPLKFGTVFLSRFPSQNERSQEDDMTDLAHRFDENVYDLNPILHPGSVFDHPRDVLSDATLSRGEKRAILASWASDAAAVMSCPALRAIPGAKRPVSIDEILEALSSLDHSPRTPPGGKPARLKSTDRIAAAA
jgi:hypothetical protein